MNDYIMGVVDCFLGVPHKSGMSIQYDLGYSAQYEREQRYVANGY